MFSSRLGWNSIDNFGMLDATCLAHQPGPNGSTAETFRKAAAWTILLDNGVHDCLLTQVVGGECYNDRNYLPPITIPVLRLLDPNSHFRLSGISIMQSCGTQEF